MGYSKSPLYDKARKLVLETGEATVTMLQRRLEIGYVTAARLMDLLEEEKVVGPYRGARPREILEAK